MTESPQKTSDKPFLIIFVILVLVLIGVIYGVYRYQQSRYGDLRFDYHGFDVGNTQQGYRFQIYINQQTEPKYFTLRTDPRETDDISVDRDVLSLKEKKEVFAVIDPDENMTGLTTMAILELDKILDSPYLFNIPVNAALLKEKEGSGLAVVDCSFVNETVGVVWYRFGEVTRVAEEDGCVVVEGVTEEDLLRASDRLVLALLGVVPVG